MTWCQGIPVLCYLLLVLSENGFSAPTNWTSQAVDPSFAGYDRTRAATCATYEIGIISDMDQDSQLDKTKMVWTSYLRRFRLSVTYNPTNPCKSKVSLGVNNNDTQTLTSSMNEAGRGMELSDLQVYNHRLLTCDDRTGIVYDIPSAESKKPVPFVILNDGNGTIPKGFKCEWETVKDGYLYAGSQGILRYDPNTDYPMFVKRISADGVVINEDWRDKFEAIRKKLGISGKGYVIHESALWSEVHKRWVFLPRQINPNAYDELKDGCFGSNKIILADDKFENIEVRSIGSDTENNPLHGYSSFKFIPGTDDQLVVALKTQECATEWKNITELGPDETPSDYVGTWLIAMTITGDILLNETFIENVKYEGIEFLQGIDVDDEENAATEENTTATTAEENTTATTAEENTTATTA